VLIDIAQSKKADLIALGTYGRKGLKRLLMGSVTSEVILNAPCDVLVVKRPCGACTGNYKSILLPFDGSVFSRKALIRTAGLSKTDNARVTILYVIPRYEEMMEFFRTESIRNSLHQEAEKVVNEAKKIASEMGIAVQAEVREGYAADEIIKTAEKRESDLIVMGTYGWKGMSKAIMGSTTNRVIANANCPILVVK
jgi:nucleotide-binding universal stress UspA family protein